MKKLKMIRVSDITERYSISASSIWNYARTGKLKSYKITSGVTMFDADEVDAFFSGKNAENEPKEQKNEKA